MLLNHLGDVEQRLAADADADADVIGDVDATEASTSRLCQRIADEFVRPMFGGALSLERGAIIDSRSDAASQPIHVDTLLCRRDAPRLEDPGGPTTWLAEHVIATLDLLPCLDAAGLSRAVEVAHRVKALRRSLRGDDENEARRSIPCFVVAFDGPARLDEPHIWLKRACRDQGIAEPDLPDAGTDRERIPSAALDGVFVLSRGFLSFDNVDTGHVDDAARVAALGACWLIAAAKRAALAVLYLRIQSALADLTGDPFDARPYLLHLDRNDVRFGN
jgi:hypothetical protein